jgi:hypothetical protein
MVGSNYGPCFLQNQCGRVKPAAIDSELLGCLRRQSNFDENFITLKRDRGKIKQFLILIITMLESN